jgi:hypothetical protein
MHKVIMMLLGGALLLATSPLWADNVEQFDGYTIHFNAFNADLLDQRVANAYQLRRGCGDGVLTVAVRKADGTAAAARVKATTMTLIGQRTTMDMHEVKDGRSIYYVGGFAIVTDADPLKFTVSIQPEGSPREHSFDFTRQLFRC